MTAHETHWSPAVRDLIAAAEARGEQAGAERGAQAVERLAESCPDCWVFGSGVTCVTMIGSTFLNGTAWTEQMCCLPCRLRALLAEHRDVRLS